MPLQRIVVRPIGWQRTTAAHKLVGGYLALKKLTLLLVPSPLDKKVDALITPNLLVVILDDILTLLQESKLTYGTEVA
jgi:hypothetical protein